MTRSRASTALRVAGVVAVMAILFAWNEGMFRERVAAGGRHDGAAGRFDGRSAIVERRTVPVTVEVAGSVVARRSASLSPRVPGIVAEVTVDEGARVREGDVLVRLSSPDLDSRGSAARGAVAAARAAVEQAEREFRRIAALHERGAATPLERERAETQLRAARGRFSRALGESSATTTIAGYASVEAPFDGLVVRRWLDPGSLAAPGVPILDLVDDSDLHAEADVPESVAMRLRVGDPVSVRIDALEEVRPGTVREIVPAADPASRTTRVEVSLPDAPTLRAGLFLRARFRVGEREALLLPAEAVRRVGELAMVDALSPEGGLEPRIVEVGKPIDDASVELLSGVQSGERVVLGR